MTPQEYKHNKLKAFAERLDTNNNESYNLTAEEATWIREIITNRLHTTNIAVRYKRNKESDPVSIIVPIGDDIRDDEDAYYGEAHDYISELIGHDPRWIRILGSISIDDIIFSDLT